MKNTDKDRYETLLNRMEVFQRKLTLIELPVKEYTFYDILHMTFDPLRRRVLKGP